MNTEDLLKRVDELLTMGQAVLGTKSPLPDSMLNEVSKAPMRGFRSAALSFIDSTYGASHVHYAEFSRHVDGQFDFAVESGIAILEVIRTEISQGWLTNLKTLVTAEVFVDFIEMAEHLLSNGYKDAAAVLGGGVLEEGLRQLSRTHCIDTEIEVDGKKVPKKADRLNTDLSKADIYNKLDQKSVVAWLDLRNKAAHGRYGEYEAAQVELMLRGVTEFLARTAT
jgi:hypothetical protein